MFGLGLVLAGSGLVGVSSGAYEGRLAAFGGGPNVYGCNMSILALATARLVFDDRRWVRRPAANIVQLARAARAQWKIENECFNTLKNQGYHLGHNFGHGHQHLPEAFFVLNLLAFFMHQIFQLVDGLYQRVRTFFSSRRTF